MARVDQIPPFIGTKDNIVVYKRWGNYYIRTKSTLSGKRVKTSPAFKKTMQWAGLLGKASKIASKVYSQLKQKDHQHYRALTGAAMKLLKEGLNEDEIIFKLSLLNKK